MKRLLTHALLGMTAVLLFPLTAFGQDTGTVSGTVVDATTEETVPGVNILLQPEDLGGVTNGEGRFSITGVPAGDYTLTASFVGYENYEQSISVEGGETLELDIELQTSVQRLDVATVTGYRVQTAGEVTGSTVQIDSETIERQNVQNPAEALQGRAAGVRVTSESGTPGAAFNIQVRGQGSINASSQPIYIVDGVQISTGENNAGGFTSYSPLAGIEPSNIQSIQVLKDAAAASIYGARAANGVVLIETKRGQAGDTRINFSSTVAAVSEVYSDYGVLSPTQWGNYQRDAANNTVGESWEAYAASNGLPTNPDEITGPNWFDAIRRTGITQDYNLSFSGGDEQTRFFLAGGAETLKGQYIAKDGSQFNLQAKVDHNVSSDFQIGANVNLSTFSKDGDVTGGIFINSPIYAPYLIQPFYEIYEDPENPAAGYNFNTGVFFNGVALSDYTDRKFNSNQIIGSVNTTWEITDWLTSRSQAGLGFEDQSLRGRRDSRIPRYAPGTATASDFRELSLNLRSLLNYNFQPAENQYISGVVGTEYRREYEQNTSASRENFPFFTLRRVSSGAEPTGAGQTATESRLLSFLGEAEYDYDNRYIARVTGRVDGSSRFGIENRYGLFGSVSAAWRISEEAFMENVDFVNNLKVRASYGILGNSEIEDFEAARLFGPGGEYGGNPGLAPQSLGNTLLTWEESRPFEMGLDYALFGNRFFGNVNFYNRVTDQLLLARDLPSDSGFFTTTENAGKIRNRGVEIAVNTINVNSGSFRWNTNFNISFESSQVLDLPGSDTLLVNASQGGGAYYRIGEPLAQYRILPAAGVNPADGRFMFRDENGNLTYDVPSVDAERYYDNALADFYGGIGNTISYKGVSLTAFFQFDYGRVADNTDLSFQDSWNQYNKSTEVLDYWRNPGDVTGTPAPALFNAGRRGSPPSSNYFQGSTYTLEDASYIRLKELRLDYEFPASLLESIGMQNASIFVQGRNLLTITDYTGIDPELVGEQLGRFPQNTTYSTGVNVTF